MRVLFLAAGALLAGTIGALAEDATAIMNEITQSDSACVASTHYNAGQHAIAYMQCRNNGIIAIFSRLYPPYLDLINNYAADRLVVAEKVEKHQITLIEANAELTHLDTALGNAITQRAQGELAAQQQQQQQAAAQAQQQADAQAQASADAQQEAEARRQNACRSAALLGAAAPGTPNYSFAAAAYYQCTGHLPPPPAPVYAPAPPMPTTTNCYPSGAGFSCTTQ